MATQSVNPRTGTPFGPTLADTDAAQLDAVIGAANAAAPRWAATPRSQRAAALSAVADRLDAISEALVALADSETGLGVARLTGEVARTTFQLRMFATLLGEPTYLPTLVDNEVAAPSPRARPELRRILVPLGPVAVFGASNFPFAFSVVGGDTASALAAGCPVVVKAHPAHPQLSEAVAEQVSAGLASAGAPAGTFALVRGYEAGRTLVADARIRAAAFTGSYEAGRALFDLAAARPEPIPFYGELGSVNPVFVTPAAARRGKALADAYLDSLTAGAGQFCTNPSVLAVPKGSFLLEEIIASAAGRPPGIFLHEGVATHYRKRLADLAGIPGARLVVAPADTEGPGYSAPLALIAMDADSALRDVDAFQMECFGPAGVVIEYDDDAQALAVADSMHGCLVATVHGEPEESLAAALIERLTRITGRIVWNGWPTGVAVSPAQHHGGPHPSTTNSLYTSIGGAATERFVRPVVFQSLPTNLIPSVGQF
jgi:NADP-dependent aldehyde dehydrogenase